MKDTPTWNFLKTSSTKYSISTIEDKASSIAKKLIPLLPKDGVLDCFNSSALCSFIVEEYNVTPVLASDMLNSLQDIRGTPLGAFRIALAILEYLPLFNKEDTTLKGSYKGSPPCWFHARIVTVMVKNTPKGCVVTIKYLMYTSVLAGNYISMSYNLEGISRLFKSMCLVKPRYKGKIYPQELFNMYLTLLIGETNSAVLVPTKYKVSSCEGKHNAMLAKARSNKSCGSTRRCAICPKGLDQCPMACRRVTKSE